MLAAGSLPHPYADPHIHAIGESVHLDFPQGVDAFDLIDTS
jgi:hypothetical protein